jgi:hypothetical protein
MAGGMAVVILLATQQFMIGSLQSFAAVSVQSKAHVDFEALREHLSRDIQHAQAVIATVTIDGRAYQTEMDAMADAIVLRLESVDVNGQVIGGLYDFVVYEGQALGKTLSSLTRRVFINRDSNGAQLNPAQGSARMPGELVLSREVRTPQTDGSITAVFTLDQPVIELVREVRLAVTLEPTEQQTGRQLPRAYTARFRLRNS